MANSVPTKTTLKKGDKLPPRGKANKTLILEVMRENAMQGLDADSTKEDAEKAFFKNIAESAFNSEDNNSGMCKKLLADKGWANLKPTSESIYFEFDEKGDLHSQSNQIMKAIANGDIAPDIGNNLINSITAMIKIKELTDFEERLKAIENASKQT